LDGDDQSKERTESDWGGSTERRYTDKQRSREQQPKRWLWDSVMEPPSRLNKTKPEIQLTHGKQVFKSDESFPSKAVGQFYIQIIGNNRTQPD
jgi:hypothetical protein